MEFKNYEEEFDIEAILSSIETTKNPESINNKNSINLESWNSIFKANNTENSTDIQYGDGNANNISNGDYNSVMPNNNSKINQSSNENNKLENTIQNTVNNHYNMEVNGVTGENLSGTSNTNKNYGYISTENKINNTDVENLNNNIDNSDISNSANTYAKLKCTYVAQNNANSNLNNTNENKNNSEVNSNNFNISNTAGVKISGKYYYNDVNNNTVEEKSNVKVTNTNGNDNYKVIGTVKNNYKISHLENINTVSSQKGNLYGEYYKSENNSVPYNASSNLPTKLGFWTKVKNFFSQGGVKEIGKSVGNFLNQPVRFDKVGEFFSKNKSNKK